MEAFLVIFLVGIIFLAGSYLLTRGEKVPEWLWGLTIGAILLRLLVGLAWGELLPRYGYGSTVEKAGYVMKDAYTRDMLAWKLAKGHDPLWRAFFETKAGDQYGGLLFISALVYRTLGAGTFRPLLMVALAAIFSGLAVVFSWTFTRRIWGADAGTAAAWIIALYPEAVLLSSSQMREPFIVTLAAFAFYELTLYFQTRERMTMLWIVMALFASVLISPPLAALILVALMAMALVFKANTRSMARRIHSREFWMSLVVIMLIIAAGLWMAWTELAPKGTSNLVDLGSVWMRRAAVYQSHLSQQASGWLQREFNKLPEIFHIPVLIFYGVLRPFLPAALVAYRLPLWYGISIWRALGWTLLLVSLIYATIRLLMDPPHKNRTLSRIICGLVWFGMILASMRGGGDDWDNPRYRLVFLTLQAGLVAWVWCEQRMRVSPGLRRAMISAALFMGWFLPWYVRRYKGFYWEVISIYHTIGLAIATVILFLIWDWARTE